MQRKSGLSIGIIAKGGEGPGKIVHWSIPHEMDKILKKINFVFQTKLRLDMM